MTKDALTTGLVKAAQKLRRQVDKIDFTSIVPWVYNPLRYAWGPHAAYLRQYAQPTCEILFLGMNPGPWGMSQTGVPFGEIAAVRDFLHIEEAVQKPEHEHPKRPIEGLSCARSEVSGRRLWGLFADRFGTSEAFFEQHFVTNYCPLVFMEDSARNVTPDKLPSATRAQLEEACDEHLTQVIRLLEPKWLIGVGAFAETCGKRVIQNEDLDFVRLARILHPSPASPAANKDWAGTATKQLVELGVWEDE